MNKETTKAIINRALSELAHLKKLTLKLQGSIKHTTVRKRTPEEMEKKNAK